MKLLTRIFLGLTLFGVVALAFATGYESHNVPDLSMNQHYIAAENNSEYTQFVTCVLNSQNYTSDEYIYLYCYKITMEGMHPWAN